MNKYLELFIDDELKNNNYYETIRKFAKNKNWDDDILSPIVNEYEENVDNFGPYRFLDAIEDYLQRLEEEKDKLLKSAEDLYEIIDYMWKIDFFELY